MSLAELLATVKETYAPETYAWMSHHFAKLFDCVAEPLRPLPSDDLPAYRVTCATYAPPDLRPMTIDTYTHVLLDDAHRACVYVDEAARRVVIGYRGTDVTTLKDVTSDIAIVLGVSAVDTRVRDSLALYDRVRARYPDYVLTVCGHSLGGTLAYIVAKHREPTRCVVFNPGSGINALFIQMLADTVKKEPWTRAVHTYKILGDVISSFSFVGETTLFRVAAADPLALHSIKSFALPVA